MNKKFLYFLNIKMSKRPWKQDWNPVDITLQRSS
jgi:hypothetical protein